MITKITNEEKKGHGPIKILYPGLAIGEGDTGLASIGRIDHANLPAGAFVAMHPHVNDEILSYFRSGKVRHTDSVGFTEYITNNRLMLMKAGKMFHHEEKVMDDDGSIEGLQIFIRPGEKDLVPEVKFRELETVHSEGNWRLLAGPGEDAELQLSSQTWIYDLKMHGSIQEIELPKNLAANPTYLLYCFRGSVQTSNGIGLQKGESLIIKEEEIFSISSNDAELVLFITDTSAPVYDGGMYSGNQMGSRSSQ